MPAREIGGNINISYALQKRASCRNFEKKPVTIQQVSNILWAGQGVVSKSFDVRRTAPSAGATYPLQLILTVRKDGVSGLDQGVYQFLPEEHALHKNSDRDVMEDLVKACFNQEFLNHAGISILIAADYERTRGRYPDKGERYVFMEAGSATQNISLEAVELNLGTVIVGAFDDETVKKIFDLEKLSPLAIMPVGQPKDKNIYT